MKGVACSSNDPKDNSDLSIYLMEYQRNVKQAIDTFNKTVQIIDCENNIYKFDALEFKQLLKTYKEIYPSILPADIYGWASNSSSSTAINRDYKGGYNS